MTTDSPRGHTAFCQIDKNNFILYMIPDGDYGKKIIELAQILERLGCWKAVNFDGGSSVRLVFKPAGAGSVTRIAGGARKVADIFYVTE